MPAPPADDAPLASTIVSDRVARKQLRGDLDAILQQALRKDPAARYPSVGAFAQDMERHIKFQG